MVSTPGASAEPEQRGSAAAEDWYLRQIGLFNRCNLSPAAIASQQFQADPKPLEIAWVRQENHEFFDLLDRLDDSADRAACFHEHVLSRFWMHEDRSTWPSAAERMRRGYVGVLRGWGIDSNGYSGAVLKGWAEHRFGLRPIWHGAAISSDPVVASRYASERLRGATGGIGGQLDLLYAYCQYELARRMPGKRWQTLYRGTHDPDAYLVKRAGGRDELVEFNTISSFTIDAEVAWAFGSRVWSVLVPLAKIVYFTGLLPSGVLQGEEEYLVLGGDFLVRSVVA